MSVNDVRKRITALILTAVMTLSMSGFSFAEAFADDEVNATDAPEVSEEETVNDEAADENAEEPEDPVASDTVDDAAEEKAIEIIPDPPAQIEREPVLSSAGSLTLPLDPAPIQIRTAAEDGRLLVVWKAVAAAEYYMVYLDADVKGSKVDAAAGCSKQFENVDTQTAHSITVNAFRAKTPQEQAAGGGDDPVLLAEGTIANVKATNRNAISISSRGGSNIGINLRTLLGEKYNGYAVSQGSCTDGKAAYYLMVSSSNQKGRIIKTQAGTGNVINTSGVINVCHGNGMALDTKRNRLVVVGRKEGNKDRRNELTVINANDDKYSYSYVTVNYGYSGPWNKTKSNGLSAISYIEKYDCFLALQRETHEILVLDPEFRVIGQIGTTITASYPGTYQAMDADERYVYLLLSAYQDKPSRQPHNLILVLDWNSENLLQLDPSANKNHISTKWMCNNNGSGRPDTAIILNTPFEAESLYHIDQGNGASRFYLAEYHSNPQYVWTTKKKTVKVKWKKVKKKVKWKRVRKNGKWKWKYKTKKVWKYKKKKKKVKVQVYDHLNRDNYVYHLDVM